MFSLFGVVLKKHLLFLVFNCLEMY